MFHIFLRTYMLEKLVYSSNVCIASPYGKWEQYLLSASHGVRQMFQEIYLKCQ